MKYTRTFLLGILVQTFAIAANCPNTIYYPNGSYLKSGSTFYYPSGSYFHSGSSTYYPSGSYLQSGSTVYYPSGSYFNSGNSIYYPNGSYLRSGSSYYYPSGSYLKSGSSFYYPSGSYARSGSTLYLENGTPTTFPIFLSALIGDYGSLRAKVEQSSERIDLEIGGLFKTDLVQMEDMSLEPLSLGFVIRTGIEGQRIVLRTGADGSVISCDQDVESPVNFTVTGSKGKATVSLRPGVDTEHIRRLIEEALR